MGKGYVIKYCIAFIQRDIKEKTYKQYVTEALRLISENTAKEVGGSYIQHKYADIIDVVKKPNKKESTAEEVISGIKNKLREL